MLAASRGESFECSLNDPLAADINPRASGHLSVHRETQAFEPIEFRVVRPVTDEVGICDQNTWRFVMCAKFSHWFSRLYEQRLVIFEFAQGANNRIESFPASSRAPGPAVNNESVGIFGHVRIEIVHKHPHGRFLMPAFATPIVATGRTDDSFIPHNFSSRKLSGSKSPRRIASATRAMSPESERSSVRGCAIFLRAVKARSTPTPALSGRRCSNASAPASNSIASKFSARSTMARNFNAAVIPIET